MRVSGRPLRPIDRPPVTGALAWMGRLVFLVLAMLAALSIIGTIAAIPSSIAGQRPGIERPQAALAGAPMAEPITPAPPPGAPLPQDDAASPGLPATAAPSVMIPAPPKFDDPLLWLEPLTYAVLALAGLLAIALLLMWRAVLALEARA